MNKVGLVQINNSFSGQNYFPYSVGIIQAYAKKHCKNIGNYEFVDLIYKKLPVKTAVEKLKDCDIVGFSLYVWNEKISLKIAKELRDINPHCLIVFGGPQVPDKAEEWLRTNRFVDVAVHGEGEHVFTLILENYKKTTAMTNLSIVPGISYIDFNMFITNPKKGRFKELNNIPSPYLDDVFDPIIQQNPNEQWLALWETNRGCPFQKCGQSVITTPDKIFRFEDEEFDSNSQLFCSDPTHVHLIGKNNNLILNQGKSDALKISFSNGLSSTFSFEHPVNKIINEQRCMVSANQLKIGDWVAIERNQNNITQLISIQNDIDGCKTEKKIVWPKYFGENEAWITGFLIGDGYISKKSHQSCVNWAVTDTTENTLKEKCFGSFGIYPAIEKISNTTKCRNANVRSRQLWRFFKNIVGIKHDYEKLEVPKFVKQSPKHIVKNFLDGLYEADGHNLNTKNGKVPALTTISLKLAEEVACLINWIGDVSLVRTKHNCGGYKKKSDRYIIEWHGKKCDNRLFGTPCIRSAIPIPYKIKRIHTIHKKYKSKNPYKEIHVKKNHSCVTRRKLKETFPDHPLLGDNWAYTKVIKIENVFEQTLYDVFVPNGENRFTTNGISNHNCTYCDWGSAIQAKLSRFDEQRLFREVDWFANHKIEFVFCCDANYGILVRDVNITKYVVKSKEETGYPKVMSVQNTKNATDRSYEVQKLLSDAGLNKGVTLSVQSMDTTTLTNIKRDNISLESYQELQRRFMRDKIETYSDMILAMPGETYESFTNGIDQIINNGQHNRIQFNNLSILPNAEMGNPEYQKKFGMQTVVSDIINFHGSLDEEIEDPSIREKQVLVIATDSMPKEDWLKTRAYCWMTALLHFDKILQIPIIVVHGGSGLKYKQIFDIFMDENYTKKYPVLDEIRKYFVWKALDIQNGGSEYCESKEWLNIWWPADEYVFIKMATERKVNSFYDECHQLLLELININNVKLNKTILSDAIFVNQNLLKLPFEDFDVDVCVNYDIMKYYRTYLEQGKAELSKIPTKYKIEKSKSCVGDWKTWFKEVVWYGNKKGAYLHGNLDTEYQLSGHH